MSWNGSGSFNRLFSWVADAAAGLDILASRMDSDTNNITSNGFGNCLTRDGQGQPTANLPMAGFRHTGVQNGVSRSDYAALGQVQDGTVFWTTAGGTADAITATYTPAITALVDGQLCGFRASGANTTTLPTFSPNGLTARNIVKNGGGFLVAGDIAAANSEVILRYNAGGTFWELLNPATATLAAGSVGTSALAAAAVTYAKIQNVAASRLLGNPTGSPAAPSEISLTAADLAFSGTALKLNTASITIQTFTSGSGTYTTPANVKWLEVRLVGGGGGGGGGQNATPGGTGGNTTFSTFTASGGVGGALGSCGSGGAASGGNVGNYPGGGGGPGTPPGTAYNGFGGAGGSSYFGGGGIPSTGSGTGGAGATNTGGGGGGGGATNVTITGSGGCGGGSGGTVIAIITSPAASYSYAVGASGAGAAGSSSGSSAGGTGGAGAAGKIEVIEHYAN